MGEGGFVLKIHLHNRSTIFFFLFLLKSIFQKFGSEGENLAAYIFHYLMRRLFNKYLEGTLSRLSEDTCYMLICRFLPDRHATNSCPFAKITLRDVVYSLLGILYLLENSFNYSSV